MNQSPYERWELNPLNDGEFQVRDYLKQNGYTVASVADIREYQLQDIDFIAYKDTIENQITIEVKNDGVISRSKNFFLETCCDIKNSKNGWFNYCGADYLYYRDKVNELVYILPMNDLRSYVAAHKDELETSYANDYRRDGSVAKVSSGLKLPVASFLGAYPQTKIVNI